MLGSTAVTFLPVPWYERKMGFSLLTIGHFQYLSNVLLSCFSKICTPLSLSHLNRLFPRENGGYVMPLCPFKVLNTRRI